MIKISPVMRNHILAWNLIDNMLSESIDRDKEYEARIYAEIQHLQSVMLLKALLSDPNIYNCANHDIRYWLNKRFDPDLNNNRIITIVDKIVRLLNA